MLAEPDRLCRAVQDVLLPRDPGGLPTLPWPEWADLVAEALAVNAARELLDATRQATPCRPSPAATSQQGRPCRTPPPSARAVSSRPGSSCWSPTLPAPLPPHRAQPGTPAAL